MHTLIQNKKAIVFDGDGTLYLGQQLISGSLEFLAALKKAKIANYICTNNSSKTPSEYAKKYKTLGLSFQEKDSLISTHSSRESLKEKKIKKLYILGTDSVIAWIESFGFTHTHTEPQAILLCYDTSLTYKKMEDVTHLLRSNIPYFATHSDLVCPTEKGPIPDVGTWITLFEQTTGRTPDAIFGKPNIKILDPILKKHACALDDIVFIGDRLYTDIALGQGNNLTTILTLTGETTQSMSDKSDIKASHICENLFELLN
jgi:HAD superfamily hydrolase (TIGR01450 family)